MYESWNQLLTEIWESPYCCTIKSTLSQEKKKYVIWPKNADLFRAFSKCPYNDLKVVIIGQDPYPQPNVADGLSFSTNTSKTPKSLQTIFNEIKRVYPDSVFETNKLDWWAEQGVLLLNTSLTVRENDPASHASLWKPFTSKVIRHLASLDNKIVWMLWGGHAKAYAKVLPNTNHLILTSDHPVSENRGTGIFTGNNHFKLANDFLEKSINWSTYKEAPYPPNWN